MSYDKLCPTEVRDVVRVMDYVLWGFEIVVKTRPKNAGHSVKRAD